MTIEGKCVSDDELRLEAEICEAWDAYVEEQHLDHMPVEKYELARTFFLIGYERAQRAGSETALWRDQRAAIASALWNDQQDVMEDGKNGD